MTLGQRIAIIVDILQKLHKLSLKKFLVKGEDHRFSTELKFFEEEFKKRNEEQKTKYDFFYGPLAQNESVRINNRRKILLQN